MLFDPNESIDFKGNTGPFIQYTHARIQSVISKRVSKENSPEKYNSALKDAEKDLLVILNKYPEVITVAAKEHSPALIANYVFELAKMFNKFYHEEPILKAEDEAVRQFRLELSAATASVIKKAMSLLGIAVPDKM